MDELLKLSIEELEHILAVAPYSEMHQMAYSIKKNRHGTGSMYQVIEGNYHHIKLAQEKITSDVIKGKTVIEIPAPVTYETEDIISEKTDVKSISEKEEKSQVIEEKANKTEKKEVELELLETQEMNLVGDVSSFIIPDKTKVSKKKKKKKSKKKSTESKENSKKKKKKSKKKKKKRDITSIEKKNPEEDITGLSDFSTWLLAHSKESHIHPLQEEKKKKKKKKKKKSKKKNPSDGRAGKKEKNKNLISEPLAALLASQGHFNEAIEMYEKLSLIFPEKSAFFAAKIENIQKDK